jgi:hypothetical protein
MVAYTNLFRRVTDNRSEYQGVVCALEDGRTLHTTPWLPDVHTALNNAEAWMKQNNIESYDIGC